MNDLCADCGVDLREGDGVVECQASISMVHSIPELKVCPELAQQIGKEDEQRLLSDKKLALLVDLDQTIVHTTNDDVDPNIKVFLKISTKICYFLFLKFLINNLFFRMSITTNFPAKDHNGIIHV